MKKGRSLNQQGFTLVEMLVGVMIFVVIATLLYGVVKTGTTVYFTDGIRLDLQQQARNAMDRIVREARESNASSIVAVDATSDKLIFSTPDESNIAYYRSGTTLVREYPSGVFLTLASDIGYLKFVKSGAELTISLKAQRTAYQQTVSFPLVEKIKLRNE